MKMFRCLYINGEDKVFRCKVCGHTMTAEEMETFEDTLKIAERLYVIKCPSCKHDLVVKDIDIKKGAIKE